VRLLDYFSAAALIALMVPAARAQQAPAPRLSDAELASVTGKFVLPNGVELALSVTSDTVVNGQLILRTVLTVDRTTQLQVFGRTGQAAGTPYAGNAGAAAAQTTGVTIALDRKSGIQTLTPTFAISRAPSVSVGGATQDPTSLGLAAVPVVAGGPAIATADGAVSLQAVRGGSQVSFAGDQLAVVNLVGQSIASAVVNSANDRTLDSVTNVSVDARNLAPYQIGAAQMRVDLLVTDAIRRIVR
jgi:hypothetical protein